MAVAVADRYPFWIDVKYRGSVLGEERGELDVLAVSVEGHGFVCEEVRPAARGPERAAPRKADPQRPDPLPVVEASVRVQHG